jgi:hypothetical protein
MAKCWASCLGGCSDKQSAEHLVSASVIESFRHSSPDDNSINMFFPDSGLARDQCLYRRADRRSKRSHCTRKRCTTLLKRANSFDSPNVHMCYNTCLMSTCLPAACCCTEARCNVLAFRHECVSPDQLFALPTLQCNDVPRSAGICFTAPSVSFAVRLRRKPVVLVHFRRSGRFGSLSLYKTTLR